MLRLLFVGDIFGKPGRRVLSQHLPQIRDQFDFIIVNGENAAGGFGLNQESAKAIFAAGADCITLGNHTWANKEVFRLIDDMRIVRPFNYPMGTAGQGFATFQVKGERITVINALGRVFMEPLDCPFVGIQNILERPDLGQVIVDFHAEATSEKMAMGYFLDGRVAAVLGTHTHVATADERILPKGTAYQTDVGMTGPYDSVIGSDQQAPISRFVDRLPVRFQVAEGRAALHACAITIENNKALSIERYRYIEPS